MKIISINLLNSEQIYIKTQISLYSFRYYVVIAINFLMN